MKTKTRDEWCEIMEGTDICFAPVLSLSEAPNYKHNVDRGTFVEIEGVVQPAPAPRFSKTPGAIQSLPAGIGEHGDEILSDWGVSLDMGALPGTTGRRRIYLMRHGFVDYTSKEVRAARDPSIARLTDTGREEARAAGCCTV